MKAEGLTTMLKEMNDNLNETLHAVRAYLKEHREELKEFERTQREIEKLLPFLAAELEKAQANGEAPADFVPENLLEYISADGVPFDGPYKAIISTAMQAAKYTQKRVKAAPVKTLELTLDALNKELWKLPTGKHGRVKAEINTSTRGKLKTATVVYSINFDSMEKGLEISKQLTPYDKRVYIACNALVKAGNAVFSLTQIYRTMGNSKQPGVSDLEKINDSLTKMGSARIYVDNYGEAEAMPGYLRFKYDGLLLPFNRVSAYVNGVLTENAIQILGKPGEKLEELPLFSFARMRNNQLTVISRELLESPIKKTDANLLIDDYLLTRIAHMKRDGGTVSNKILYKSIYENCDIATTKQRQRAPEKIKKYLDHYKKCSDGIKGYRKEPDGVTIIF